MKIKEFTWMQRFDFGAILECEHCGATQKIDSGYNDMNYHANVLPEFHCKKCKKNRAGQLEELIDEKQN